jgi:glycosidase
VDSGYDVANYEDVHPDYGTLGDLDAVVKAAHERGMLVYLDMVFNHTSDQHPWFQSALTGTSSPFFNYFVWNASPATRCSDVPAASFGPDRWTYVDAAGLYYFHQFFPRQPDLNFKNPAVQEELLNVLKFWMKRDIDGFRFDVPDRYFEEGDLCTKRPATLQFHQRLRDTISGDGKLARGFVAETWGLVRDVLPYFGPHGDPMIFNFPLLGSFYTSIAVGSSPTAVANEVDLMMRDLPAESRWGLVQENHDIPRFADVASGDPARLRLAASVLMTLPGVPYMWMGEELGLRMGKQVKVDWRDGSRTPYPWDASPGFGFTTAKTPHLAFGPDSAEYSYASQRENPASLLNFYRRLIALRNAHAALNDGSYATVYRDDSLWVYKRSAESETVWVAHNFARSGSVDWHFEPNVAVTDLVTGEVFAPGAAIPVAASESRILLP